MERNVRSSMIDPIERYAQDISKTNVQNLHICVYYHIALYRRSCHTARISNGANAIESNARTLMFVSVPKHRCAKHLR
jgi:hypothetical protein